MDQFRAWQWASKYLSPRIMAAIIDARRGTPILPRDFSTAMLANRLLAVTMPNGRTLYPMPARTDVSQSLDTISQTPGDMLIRGENGWEARGAAEWGGFNLLGDVTITSAVSEVVSPSLAGITILLVATTSIATSNSVQRAIQMSADDGASWYSATGNYQTSDAAGLNTTRPAIYPQEQVTTSARLAAALIIGLNQPSGPVYIELNRWRFGSMNTALGGINRARVVPLSNGAVTGTMTSGRVRFWGL